MSARDSLFSFLRRKRWAKRLGLPRGHTMVCDHCGGDLLAQGHEEGCATQMTEQNVIVYGDDGLPVDWVGPLREDFTPRQAQPQELPSLPWTWAGGYPQRITGPDATLIAEVFESPDAPAVIAPTICEAVNARFGWDGEKTYPTRIKP